MSHSNTHRPLRINLRIPPFPPRHGPVTFPGLSSNPSLKYLANDIETSTELPQHYHIDPSTFYVKWDQTDLSQFTTAVPHVTALTNDNMEEVLALAEKRNGKDLLLAFAHYWIDRRVYETRWDVQGQPYLAVMRPPLHAAESSNTFAARLGALHNMGTYMHASAAMAAPGGRMSGGFSDPRVRAAFEGQANEMVSPQRSAVPVHHSIDIRGQDFSVAATGHRSFLSPQEIREDFHNRGSNATAHGPIEESSSSGYLARASPHRGVDTGRGKTSSIDLGTETEGAQGQKETVTRWGHLNAESKWVVE